MKILVLLEHYAKLHYHTKTTSVDHKSDHNLADSLLFLFCRTITFPTLIICLL